MQKYKKVQLSLIIIYFALLKKKRTEKKSKVNNSSGLTIWKGFDCLRQLGRFHHRGKSNDFCAI